MKAVKAYSPGISMNLARFRLDSWAVLRRAAQRIRMLAGQGRDAAGAEQEAGEMLEALLPFEKYWVFPRACNLERMVSEFRRRDFEAFAGTVKLLEHHLSLYGDRASMLGSMEELTGKTTEVMASDTPHYFTVLTVSSITEEEAGLLDKELEQIQVDEKDFIYQLLLVDNFKDALIAALFNYDIQACIIEYDVPFEGAGVPPVMEEVVHSVLGCESVDLSLPLGPVLARVLKELRPTLDLYLLTDETAAGEPDMEVGVFRRVFYGLDVPSELHMTILEGLHRRFRTPFFNALKANAAAPIGNFHALPIARGNSIFNSKWIQEMVQFYGPNIFMAETSSTTGGLDSLLAPTGSIREAQEKAADTWGARHTFFATSGTSTSNKIVVQALTRPGDIVLIDRNCHKSHHYGMVMAGAYPLYLEAYPLPDYSFFGAVPLRTIKSRLLQLKKMGRLDRVRMLLLTNCTFDGIVYNPVRVMEEVLAIKPDICFLWDEAWYAFAHLVPHTRWRTAMNSARVLEERYQDPGYAGEYAAFRERHDALDPDDELTWLDNRLLPDPEKLTLRVYSTHSTHKSLSALRQGSMIHVYDWDFARKSAGAFNEAFLAHTSTSPNYQIIASLDLARRQADLEGYGMVSDIYNMAEMIRAKVESDPLLSRYFRILPPGDLIPEEYRNSGLTSFTCSGRPINIGMVADAWENDEFVLDPTRITLYLASTGFNGNEFKVDVLMDRYGIQVNKTSINSVLLIITIGVTWSSVAHLLDVLSRIAQEIDSRLKRCSPAEARVFQRKVDLLSSGLPDLPTFSCFHRAFRPHPESPEGDIRKAYYLEYDEENHEFISLEEARDMVDSGRELVSANFVVPYPPGFPVLVPGQVISPEILEFMAKLDVSEIHGYRPELGLSVFTDIALAGAAGDSGCA